MRRALGVLLATWFAGTLQYSYSGKFRKYSSGTLLGAGMGFPAAAYLCLFAISRQFRAVIESLSPRSVTLFQSPRAIAGVLVFLQYKRGVLPARFAWPTGTTDSLFGASAFFTAYVLVSPGDNPKSGFILWHRLGLAGLLISSASGILTSRTKAGILHEGLSSEALSSFPMSMVPTFVGPMMILLHMVALDIATAGARKIRA